MQYTFATVSVFALNNGYFDRLFMISDFYFDIVLLCSRFSVGMKLGTKHTDLLLAINSIISS